MSTRASGPMHALVERYLTHRRACGYRLTAEGSLLADFARFADNTAPQQPLTTRLALQWASLPASTSPLYRSRRLDTLRVFGRFCRLFDARTEVLPTHLSRTDRRRVPYILTAEEIRLIIRRTDTLRIGASTLRPLTFRTLVGLVACTGVRIGEALKLRYEDIDARAGTLHVARAKFSPERDLPIHPTTLRALERYRKIRHRHFPIGEHLFVGPGGGPLNRHNSRDTFRHLVRGFPPRGARLRPRFHDLRHAFATRLVAQWSRQEEPVAHRLLLLSRYLGHQHFEDTYWYVEPERHALEAAAARFERFRSSPHGGLQA